MSVVLNLEKSGSRDNQFSDAFHLAENTVTRCIHGQIQTEIDNIQKVSNSHHTYVICNVTVKNFD